VSKDYILLYAVGGNHSCDEELLSDLLNWKRMCALHASPDTPKYVALQAAKGMSVRQLQKKTEEESNPSKWKKFDKTVEV